MPLADKVQQLDEQITSAVKNKLASLRHELNERLQQSTEAIRERLDGLETGLPTSFLGDRDLEPIAAEAAAGARTLALSDLTRALAALDRAGSQAAVLATLLEHACAHASRAALFLTPAEAARGWRGEGFADAGAAIPGLTISYAAGTAWGALAEGRGTVALSPADCADMASRLESPIPREAVLIPLVLADRIAAALYADRSDDRALEVTALQALVHFAAQAIELLPLRTRNATPTLQVPGAVEGEGAGLPLWVAPIGGPAAEAAPAVEPPAPVEIAAPVETAEEAAEPVAEAPPVEAEAAPSAAPLSAAPWAVEPELPPAVEAEQELAPEPAAPVEAEEPVAPIIAEPPSFFAPRVEPPHVAAPELAPPEAGPDPLAIASWEETAAEFFPSVPVEEEAPAADLSSPAATATLPAFTAEESPALPWPEPAAVEEIEEYELPPVEEVAAAPEQAWPGEEWPQESELLGDETAVETPAGTAAAYTPPSFESPAFEPPPFLAAEPPALEPSTAALDMPSLDLADDETILLSRQSATVAVPMPPVAASAPPAPEPADEPEEEATHPGRVPFATTRFAATPSEAPRPPAPGAGPGATAEVRPPSGFEGPGLAFAAGPRAVPGAGESPAHEEARRLARLLVSEIRLYNEEQVEEGRRNRDIYFRLRDEIDRSRKMYDERIAPEVRSANDYFTEELIRRLADGDPDALGM